MLLEVIDSLHCVADHDETWLVATVSEWRELEMWSGVLGCPICRAEYPVRDGVAAFTPNDSGPSGLMAPAAHPTEDDVARLAALLDLRDAGGARCACGDAWWRRQGCRRRRTGSR